MPTTNPEVRARAYKRWYEKNKEWHRAWRHENSEHLKQYQKENYDSEKAKARAADWKARNEERVKGHTKDWIERNRARKNSLTTKRRAQELLATCKWADEEAIVRFYEEAQRLTKETGIPHEVDHIVPLLGKNVCGLHWEGNLQILTKSANSKKNNKEIHQ